MAGILFLSQFLGLMVGFILLVPITTSAYLENAAAVSPQLRLSVLLLLATGFLTIGMSIFMFPYLREHSYRMALWLLALSIVWFAMQAVDNQNILSLMSLSQQYAGRSTPNADLINVVADSVRVTRRWSHYTELLVMDLWYFMFYFALLRFSLVPRALAGFGLLMVIVHAVGIALPVFVGYPSVLVLAYSMLLAYVAVGGWLVVKGFRETNGPVAT
jgi:hypothetical protein